MAIEIERKFLVHHGLLDLTDVQGEPMQQGYLASGAINVRVRLTSKNAYLTLKSTGAGLRRMEFEYEIPTSDAQELLARPELLGVLRKTRYCISVDSFVFEVDVYEGALHGLITAEVEIPDEATKIPTPTWLGTEVSHLKEYSNESLACKGIPDSYSKLTAG